MPIFYHVLMVLPAAQSPECSSDGSAGNTQAVLVHQLSKGATQNPFRRNRGRVTSVLFHPAKPFLFVATQNSIRIYDLMRQALAKRLLGGGGVISSMAVHPSGDHVIAGSAVCLHLCPGWDFLCA